jgi:PEP-CTERM motif
MNPMQKTALAAALVGALLAPAADARLVFTGAEIGTGSFVQGFDDAAGYDLSGSRVQIGTSLGVNLGVSAANGTLNFGAPTGAWSLGSNGEWTSAKTFVGVDGGADADNNVIAEMSFDFGGKAVSAVGAFMNFDPDFVYGGGLPLPLYIAAYDRGGNLLESYDLPVFTANQINQGSFYGIALDGASIARFVISGPYAVADDLTFSVPVPEPSTYVMMAAGLAVLAGVMRRRSARRE